STEYLITTFMSSDSGSVAVKSPTSGIQKFRVPAVDWPQPSLLSIAWIAAFIEIDIIENRLHIGAIFKTAFAQPALQNLGRFIVPAALPHELVPDLDLLVRWFAAMLEAPFENFLVAAAFLHARDDRRVFDPQKVNDASIKADAEILLKIRGQLPRCVQTDFVEHAREVKNAAHFFMRTAKAGNVHARFYRR